MPQIIRLYSSTIQSSGCANRHPVLQQSAVTSNIPTTRSQAQVQAGSHSLRQVIVGNPFVSECVGIWEVGRQAGDTVHVPSSIIFG